MTIKDKICFYNTKRKNVSVSQISKFLKLVFSSTMCLVYLSCNLFLEVNRYVSFLELHDKYVKNVLLYDPRSSHVETWLVKTCHILIQTGRHHPQQQMSLLNSEVSIHNDCQPTRAKLSTLKDNLNWISLAVTTLSLISCSPT